MVFALHFAATFFMVGLSWFVQLVHYPLLGEVVKYRESAYEQTRMRAATWVVAPPMLLEMVTGVVLVWRPQPYFPQLFAAGSLALLVIIWLSTAFLQAPRHEILSLKFVEKTHRSLISTNFVRTLGWSLRGLILLYALLQFV